MHLFYNITSDFNNKEYGCLTACFKIWLKNLFSVWKLNGIITTIKVELYTWEDQLV